jgi:hypothetical protein
MKKENRRKREPKALSIATVVLVAVCQMLRCFFWQERLKPFRTRYCYFMDHQGVYYGNMISDSANLTNAPRAL